VSYYAPRSEIDGMLFSPVYGSRIFYFLLNLDFELFVMRPFLSL